MSTYSFLKDFHNLINLWTINDLRVYDKQPFAFNLLRPEFPIIVKFKIPNILTYIFNRPTLGYLKKIS